MTCKGDFDTGGPGRILSILAAISFLLATAWAAAAESAAPGDLSRRNLPDEEIGRAVETELIIDDVVTANFIDADSDNGVITLTGEVGNLLAKERAAALAETVKGVRSVVNRLNVKPSGEADSSIEKNVEWALTRNPATEAYEVEVEVDNAEVVLTGTVDSWQERRLAEQVAKSVSGVEHVRSEIEWIYDVDRADADIEGEIAQALKMNAWIDHSAIDVEVNDGHVALEGIVSSAAERRRARNRSWVAGVQSVDARGLEIEWWADDAMQRERPPRGIGDDTVREAVVDALIYDPRVTAQNIDIQAINGHVTLTGRVLSLRARSAAEQDARNTVGVTRVTNLLKIRPGTVVNDQDLVRDIKRSLTVNPAVEPYEIDVDAYNGRVHLYGRVDSAYEREMAEEIAERQLGVLEVSNHLETDDWDYKSDFEIAEDIQDQMFWSPFVDSDDVEVVVADGVATLTGTVNSWSEHQSAIENAYEGGARRVVDELAVTYAPPGYAPAYLPYMPPIV